MLHFTMCVTDVDSALMAIFRSFDCCLFQQRRGHMPRGNVIPSQEATAGRTSIDDTYAVVLEKVQFFQQI